MITIGSHTFQFQKITTLFAFCPETFFAPAIKSYFTRLLGLFKSFLIHKTQHEYNMGIEVLNDSRNEAIGVFRKVYVHN